MSDSERPDIPAFEELDQLIHALGDEMAAWRRRAHEAEARLKEAEVRSAAVPGAAEGAVPAGERPAEVSSPELEELKRENQALRQRLEGARVRTGQLLDKLRFLRQQHEHEAER